MIKRQRQRKYDDNSLSVKFTGHSHRTVRLLIEQPCNTKLSFLSLEVYTIIKR